MKKDSKVMTNLGHYSVGEPVSRQKMGKVYESPKLTNSARMRFMRRHKNPLKSKET